MEAPDSTYVVSVVQDGTVRETFDVRAWGPRTAWFLGLRMWTDLSPSSDGGGPRPEIQVSMVDRPAVHIMPRDHDRERISAKEPTIIVDHHGRVLGELGAMTRAGFKLISPMLTDLDGLTFIRREDAIALFRERL